MQRSNTFLILAVAAGLILMTVWRLLAEEIPRPPGTGDNGPDVVVPDTPAPVAPSPDVPDGAPRVVVIVTPREIYVPPPASRVRAFALPQREELAVTMLAGTGANPWGSRDERMRAGVALVAIDVDGGRLIRQAGLEVLTATELGLGAELTVTGSVRDAAQQPVVGARVWFGAIDDDGPREVVTDETGRFEAVVRASDGVPLVVRKEGYASTWRPIRVDVDGAREHAITLAAAGVLAVQVAGQSDDIGSGSLFVVPAAQRSAELSRYPFFLQAVLGGAPFDANGQAAIRDLPQEGLCRAVVVHPLVPVDAGKTVKLEGAHTIAVVPLTFRAGRHVSVIDDAGAALGHATALLRPGGRAVHSGSALMLLPPRLAASGCLFSESAAAGRLFLGAVDDPDTVLSLRAAGHAGRDIPYPTAETQLVLPRWQGGEVVLRVQPPAAGVAWRIQVDVGEGVDLGVRADEDAVVALPHAGAFDLQITTLIGDDKRGERAYRGVSATGPVVLPAPKIE